MDIKKIGQFIAALRKSKGFTQQDVANRLGITDKTVSKWECGNGLPDITLIPALAELFGVTSDELLRGERFSAAEPAGQASRKSAELADCFIENKCQRQKKILYIALGLIVCSLFTLYILSNTLFFAPVSCGVSFIVCVGSAILCLHVLSDMKQMLRNKMVAVLPAASMRSRMDGVLRLANIVVFLIIYVAVLDISLSIGAAEYGGQLPLIVRENAMHHVIAVFFALAGTFAISRTTKNIAHR